MEGVARKPMKQTNKNLVLRKGQLSGNPFWSKNGQDFFLFSRNEDDIGQMQQLLITGEIQRIVYYQTRTQMEVVLIMEVILIKKKY